MVGVDQDRVAALVPGEMLSGLQQLPPHALAPEFRKDVECELGEVEVVHERQCDVRRPDNHAVDLGHEDHLAFVGVRHLKKLLLRSVGKVIGAPGLHPDPSPHFDGGEKVGGIGRVKGIGDPQLLNPYIVCHRGHHPSRCATHHRSGPAQTGLSTASICWFGPLFHW